MQYEVLPLGRSLTEEAAALPPLAVTVTCSPRHGIEATIATSVHLAEAGHSVTPHLAARQIRGSEHLTQLLSHMRDAGINEAFVIGGDASQAQGPYRSGADLLRALAAHPLRPLRLGVAAYPEGHPSIPSDALRGALRDNARHADYFVTQMCFDASALAAWLGRTRADGITLPAMLGIPGAVERHKLLEVSARIGVGESLRFLRKQHGLLRLLTARPGQVSSSLLSDLSPALSDRSLGVAGCHLYTFNRLASTVVWAQEQHLSAIDDHGGPASEHDR